MIVAAAGSPPLRQRARRGISPGGIPFAPVGLRTPGAVRAGRLRSSAAMKAIDWMVVILHMAGSVTLPSRDLFIAIVAIMVALAVTVAG
jgi:hypothetical protein